MQTKLTLRLDDTLIARAKAHAARTGRSVSSIVADYFALLGAPEPAGDGITPRVRALRGVLKGSGLDEADYRAHLEENHL